MVTKFLRRNWNRNPKLGKGRKKKQTWRKPKGRDNKMREKRKGYPAVVSIGYKKSRISDKINYILNSKALDNIQKNDRLLLGKVGKKKKIEIAKKAKEKRISFENFNVDKFLKILDKSGEKNGFK